MGEVDLDGYSLALLSVEDPRGVLEDSYKDGREVTEIEVRSLQRLAAICLGWMGHQEATGPLHGLLRSGDGGVRVAAAMSLVRLLKAYKPVHRPADTEAESKTDEPDEVSRESLPALRTAGGKD